MLKDKVISFSYIGTSVFNIPTWQVKGSHYSFSGWPSGRCIYYGRKKPQSSPYLFKKERERERKRERFSLPLCIEKTGETENEVPSCCVDQ